MFRRLERKNRGSGMDQAGFWILALFEYFLTKLGCVQDGEEENVVPLSLLSLTTDFRLTDYT